MTYIVPRDVAEANRRKFILQNNNQFDHCAMVIRSICELEYQCARLLFAFFQTRNDKLSWEKAENELFGENGSLGSLTRMARIGFYLGLLGEDEVADLRTLAKLRNMYAHGRERNQFYDDPKVSALVKKLRLYVQSPTLSDHDDQGIFLSCYSVLYSRLSEKSKSFERNISDVNAALANELDNSTER